LGRFPAREAAAPHPARALDRGGRRRFLFGLIEGGAGSGPLAAAAPELGGRLRQHPDRNSTARGLTIQRRVLDLMQRLTDETGTSQLVVTADLGIAAQYCDTVAVMHAGRIVEMNRTREFFAAPAHPYARRLLDSVRLEST
jgi:hypothetical protein